MSARKVLWIFVAVAIVLSVAFVPITSLSSPAWEVWITDQGGHPIPGITVRLTHRNYSAESQTHEINATTDGQGHLTFSAQTVSASLARRVVAMLSSAMAGVHASFGPHASVFASGDGLQGVAVDERGNVLDWTGKPAHMESRIVLAPPTSTVPITRPLRAFRPKRQTSY
jgi:hypothetical protein